MKKEKHTLTAVADEICRPVVRVCCFYTAGRDVYKQTYVTVGRLPVHEWKDKAKTKEEAIFVLSRFLSPTCEMGELL